MTTIEEIVMVRPKLKNVSSSGINLLDLPIKEQRGIILRILSLELEAKEFKSNLYCPNCETNLPKREPFFGWDNDKGEPSYYCTLCDTEFNEFIKPSY